VASTARKRSSPKPSAIDASTQDGAPEPRGRKRAAAAASRGRQEMQEDEQLRLEREAEEQDEPQASGVTAQLYEKLSLPGSAAVFGQARAHPVITALATAATAWLAYEGTRRGVPSAVYRASRNAAESAGEGVSHALRTAKDDAAIASDTVRRGASGVVSGVRDGAMRSAAYGRDVAGDLWDDHPLAASSALFALAVTAGMLLPATSVEEYLAGERSAQLLEVARTRGGKLLKRSQRIAGNLVREGAAAAAEEAERVGLTPERIARKVKRIASRVTETVSDVGDD
jgi:hypothetical protein